MEVLEVELNYPKGVVPSKDNFDTVSMWAMKLVLQIPEKSSNVG